MDKGHSWLLRTNYLERSTKLNMLRENTRVMR
jgi:hypothetical protein